MTVTEWIRRMPWTVPICAGGLIALGLAAIDRGDELLGSTGLFPRQAVWGVISTLLMFAATIPSYRGLRRWSMPLFLLSIGLLVMVFFMPARNGSHRWIPLGIMYFQPSELAKLAMILALAHYLMHRDNYRKLSGLIVPFALTLLPVGLVLREPDLGTSLVFLPVLFAMLFAAGARPRHLAVIILLGILCTPALWLGMNAEQKSRVTALFQQREGGAAPQGDSYHQHQSKQVIALGGAAGSLVSGTQMDDLAAYHLPAARTDFVFCLIAERFGLWGAVGTLLVCATLFGAGLRIAARTREPFGRLVAVGVVALLAAETLINTGMTVGLTPVTGLTLPLVSYGGSSLVATCLALGLLLNVAIRPGYEVAPEPFRFRKQLAQS